jgi:hypothetical protein
MANGGCLLYYSTREVPKSGIRTPVLRNLALEAFFCRSRCHVIFEWV